MTGTCARLRGPDPCGQDTAPGRSWCPPCAQEIHRALAALPEVYVELHVALSPANSPGEPVSGTATAPLPIRTDVRALAEDILDATTTWESDLRRHLGHSTRPPRGREAPTLVGAVRYLTAYLGEAITYSPEEAERVAWLRNLARVALGQTRLVHHLRGVPCPNLECGVQALVRVNGESVVHCEACGRAWTEDEYQRLVVVLVSELTA